MIPIRAEKLFFRLSEVKPMAFDSRFPSLPDPENHIALSLDFSGTCNPV